jgi:hypothetical protein
MSNELTKRLANIRDELSKINESAGNLTSSLDGLTDIVLRLEDEFRAVYDYAVMGVELDAISYFLEKVSFINRLYRQAGENLYRHHPNLQDFTKDKLAEIFQLLTKVEDIYIEITEHASKDEVIS